MARSRAKDYDDKRLSMLHRSAELFAASGYVGTSMNTIADACGVSKALLYHYYPDKEAILVDILSSHLEKLVAAVRKASAQAGDPVERFRTIVATLLELYRHTGERRWLIAATELAVRAAADVTAGTAGCVNRAGIHPTRCSARRGRRCMR